ncbi:MAG TPA: CxxxxCH/CxxCH domain-containing protein [Anaeromyxobacter sp.]|nr:CxxxxCH/CxxCH domain-containing protein [Anaeromyxobacter sp.]
MARLTLDDALRALAVTLLFAGACESRAPIGPNRQPIQTGPCEDCHAAPPPTGAHLAHTAPGALDGLAYGDLRILEDVATGGTRYVFGCGHCHPIDPAAHEADLGADGLPDVVLTPPAQTVPGDAIKHRNTPQAAWDPATGTCSGVYCHSSGRDSLGTPFGYVATPPWTATPGALGCDGCHGNPPRYPSAGPESAAPNSHIQLAEDGWEWGHYAGMSGPYHGTRHGSPTAGYASAPITCQTCHYETVDPSHTKPDGFYYLDTSGDYALEGGAAARTTYVKWQRTQCATCHAAGSRAPPAPGAVLPLRHVNGRPDVVFDPRPALPDGYATGLPALATTAPVAPYYVTPFNVSLNGWPLAPGAEVRVASDGSEVLTVSLEHATYDPASRTCSNVGCHLSRQSLVDSGALGTPPPLRWGDEYKLFTSCEYCHSML